VKALLCLLAPLVAALAADVQTDRLAIEAAIAAVNDPELRPAAFTADAHSDVDFDRLIDLHWKPAIVIGMDEPWRNLTVPRIVSGKIFLIAPGVAVADCASTIRGAVTLAERVPLLFVLKKIGKEWRIAEVRLGKPQPPRQVQGFFVSGPGDLTRK
jgi:hypothetical protein